MTTIDGYATLSMIHEFRKVIDIQSDPIQCFDDNDDWSYILSSATKMAKVKHKQRKMFAK